MQEELRPELQKHLQDRLPLVIGRERQAYLSEVVREGAGGINSARNPKAIIEQLVGITYTPPEKEAVVKTIGKLKRADEEKIRKEFDSLSAEAQARAFKELVHI